MYVATGLGHNVIIMKLVTFFNRLVESADLLPPKRQLLQCCVTSRLGALQRSSFVEEEDPRVNQDKSPHPKPQLI